MATPQRIVSLVPSDTFNVVRLGARSRLVGRTRYCVEPPGLDDIPAVGGTKSVRVDKLIALEPDLVIANREENARDDVLALIDAGLDVMLTFPRSVRDGLDRLLALALRLGVEHDEVATPLLDTAGAMRAGLADTPLPPDAPRCFVAIWRDPWMTVNDDTYIGDALRVLGLRNVFGDLPSSSPDGRDTRYPVVQMDEVIARAPQVVLLPDEPYPFSPEHARELSALPVPAARSGAVVCVSGRDLCWHGAWAIDGLPRLRNAIRGRV